MTRGIIMRLLATALAALLAVSAFAACTGQSAITEPADEGNRTTDSAGAGGTTADAAGAEGTTAGADGGQAETSATSAADAGAATTEASDGGSEGGQATTGADAAADLAGNNTLTIGTTEFSGVFQYFFHTSAYDKHIIDLTSIPIYETGRGGALEEGACYYNVPEVIYGPDGDPAGAIYTFQLKPGLTFSDGHPITADDIIFTFKCMASPAYGGLAALHTLPIQGIMEYRYDDPDFQAKLDDIKARSEIVTEEELYEACFIQASDDFEVDTPEVLIEEFGLEIDPALSPGSAQFKQAVVEATVEVYMRDYSAYFIPDIQNEKEQRLTNEYVSENIAGGVKVTDIAGIEKVDDLTVRVTTEGVDPTAEEQLAVLIMPEHYYGEGITKVDFDAIKQKSQAPMGGGPYIFESFNNNVLTMRSNPSYYRGEPNIERLRFIVIDATDQEAAAASGIVDAIEVSCTPEAIELLESNGKYCMIYDRNGWGYVGVSAKLLPEIDVRRGLMHAMNRALGVNTYYGNLAVVLERPITMASWGYPEENAPIFDYNLDKALECFLAAGYTQQGGKLVDSNGKPLQFTAYQNSTNHPVVPLYTQMKNDLEAMGAEFSIEQINPSVMFDMMSTGDCMIWAAAYGDGSPDPDCYQVFHSDSIRDGNNPYYTSDPEVDRLIMEGRRFLDRDVRLPIYNELYRKIVETATCMPYYQRMEMYAFNPDVIDVSSLVDDPDPFYNFYAGLPDMKLR